MIDIDDFIVQYENDPHFRDLVIDYIVHGPGSEYIIDDLRRDY